MSDNTKRGQKGFSLAELMVALTVTMIISGGIFALLTAGNTAFRKEPELADQQQALRVAMDLISRDILDAGEGLPITAPVFTALDSGGGCTAGLNGCGMAGSMGTAAAAARTGDGVNTDVLEIVGAEGSCPALRVCSGTIGEVSPFVTREQIPDCMTRDGRLPGLVLITDGLVYGIQAAVVGAVSGRDSCGGGFPENRNGSIDTRTVGLGAWAPSGVPKNPVNDPVYLYGARVVRYRVAPGPDPTIPVLWRSSRGRYNAAGSSVPDPGVGAQPANSPWQVVGQGIEDLQIQYLSGAGVWSNSPPNPPPPNGALATTVMQVRIALSARITAGNPGEMKGATNPPAGGVGPMAIRGTLVSVVAPRRNLSLEQMVGNEFR